MGPGLAAQQVVVTLTAVALVQILAVAVALAMDALAVSVAAGVKLRTISGRQTFRLAWHFGLFQALMPILGWTAGLTVRGWIEAVDHWLAFGLLGVIGIRMVVAGVRGDDDGLESGSGPAEEPTRGWTLVMLSVATSIDALAVGFSLAVLHIDVWLPSLVIGLVAGAFTVGGLQLGGYVGRRVPVGRWANILGGTVLVGIGVHILHDHGVF